MIEGKHFAKRSIMMCIKEYGELAATCGVYDERAKHYPELAQQFADRSQDWRKLKDEVYRTIEILIEDSLKSELMCDKCYHILIEKETHGGKKYFCPNCGWVD